PPAAGRETPPAPDPLCDPGGDRPPDVHAVHDPSTVAPVLEVRGAQAAGVVRPRAHADQAPGAAPLRVAPRNSPEKSPTGGSFGRLCRTGWFCHNGALRTHKGTAVRGQSWGLWTWTEQDAKGRAERGA